MIEKYFEACNTFQDLSNFRKIVLDILAIQETFGNHKEIFWTCKTIQDFSNIRKVIWYILAIQDTFKNHRKIFWSLQDIPGLVKLQEKYLGHFDNPGDF